MSPHQLSRRAASLFSLVLLGACAAAGPPLPAAPPPEAIPELQEQLREQPENPDLLVRLGAAHRGAGQPAEALPLLERARERNAADPEVHFFLGMVNEDLGRPGEALEAYRAYLERTDDPSAGEALEGRLRLLRRQQLRQAAQEALAREGELADTRPAENRVAVFPFMFGADDESLRPLSRALAAMLATDLAQTDRLTVLERLSVQALLDEIDLGGTQLVDPATAARSGRLLGAGTIVQGRIGGSMERLALDAALVEVTDPETGESRTVAASDVAERLLDMEKRLVFDLYEAMGVSLTAAERERVSQRPTENLQALLAYGRGLEAADRGDFAEAAQHFRQAAEIDPAFEQAEAEAEESEEMAEAAETSTDELAAAAPAASVAPQATEVPVPEPLARDPAAEVLGTERLGGGAAILEVIIRLPGGGR